MIVHRKQNEKKKSQKPTFYRKPFSQKAIPNIVSMGSTGKILRNNGKNEFSTKYHFQKKL